MILNTTKASVAALVASAVLAAACASSPKRSMTVQTHEGHTVVEVIPPGASELEVSTKSQTLEPLEPYGARVERFLIDWVSKNRGAVDDCYLAEALSSGLRPLSAFEFQVLVLTRKKNPLVRMLSASQPEQELLGYCIGQALARLRFPRGTDPIRLLVPIEQPADLW